MAAVAAAHDCLADAACRRAFDEGAQLERRQVVAQLLDKRRRLGNERRVIELE